MSGSAISYAAAVSTPNGSVRQPKIKAQTCPDPDISTSFEIKENSSRPGAGIRSGTSFRGWTKKTEKSGREKAAHQSGPVTEIRHSGHIPRDEHRPKTEHGEELVYILTMNLSDSLATPMNKMREQHFPKKLNRIPAHMTLFHALPHSQFEALEEGLSRLSANTQPFVVSTGKPFRMRKGVGVNVDAGYKKMKDLHQKLQLHWLPFLSEQDAGGFRPHWTVMNKVDDETVVETAFETIRKELSESNQEGRAFGLDLWKYNRGNWEWAKIYLFGEASKATLHSPGARNGQVAAQTATPGEQNTEGLSKRPGMWKRGSSVGDTLRTMSFRRKS